MKPKNKIWIKALLGFSILIILIIVIFIIKSIYEAIYGPTVGFKERKYISDYAERYLTKKYGDHKFKVTKVYYDYDMGTLFDYSTKTGYYVDFECDVLKHSFLTIDGVYPNNVSVSNDWVIEYYYFLKENGMTDNSKMNGAKPIEKAEDIIQNRIIKEYDTNCYDFNLYDYDLQMDIPNDYGKIPTLYEIKNDLSLYSISRFDYKTKIGPEIEEYKNLLKEYLENNFGGEWEIDSNYREDGGYYLIKCDPEGLYRISNLINSK